MSVSSCQLKTICYFVSRREAYTISSLNKWLWVFEEQIILKCVTKHFRTQENDGK